jgi:hypothetical protein
MIKKIDEIMKHSGKTWLTQAIIDLAESLNPTRIFDQRKVKTMIQNLVKIRDYEQKIADKKANEI